MFTLFREYYVRRELVERIVCVSAPVLRVNDEREHEVDAVGRQRIGHLVGDIQELRPAQDLAAGRHRIVRIERREAHQALRTNRQKHALNITKKN